MLRRGMPARLMLAANLLLAQAAFAADIGVAGLFPGKAVLTVDGGSPKTFSVGSTVADGVKLIAVDGASATLDVNGRRQSIGIGEHATRSSAGGRDSVTLKADGRGHFTASGAINGMPARMLVDTGATLIAIPAGDAKRFGIDYRRGQPVQTSTANGVAPGYRVRLDTVKVGDIELAGIDALVLEQGLSTILLGMSFLNRTEMRRDGEDMVLTKRF
ncbi:aspartyl protease family protein [Noviherbaspirillum humi]|uniref:Aspartyl protease family protein n=2 Tax=Noviherbaspirillum humi TaxID=1688639 RepID=A0A239GP26_9BURK|nr:aspartyl protease family protein [Noviherbaspirillum humi]